MSRVTWGIEESDTGIIVAQGDAPTVNAAAREAIHYAMQYGQDGPVRYWVRHGEKTLVRGTLKCVTTEPVNSNENN